MLRKGPATKSNEFSGKIQTPLIFGKLHCNFFLENVRKKLYNWSKICNIIFWIENYPPAPLALFRKFIRFGSAPFTYLMLIFDLPTPPPPWNALIVRSHFNLAHYYAILLCSLDNLDGQLTIQIQKQRMSIKARHRT